MSQLPDERDLFRRLGDDTTAPACPSPRPCGVAATGVPTVRCRPSGRSPAQRWPS